MPPVVGNHLISLMTTDQAAEIKNTRMRPGMDCPLNTRNDTKIGGRFFVGQTAGLALWKYSGRFDRQEPRWIEWGISFRVSSCV